MRQKVSTARVKLELTDFNIWDEKNPHDFWKKFEKICHSDGRRS